MSRSVMNSWDGSTKVPAAYGGCGCECHRHPIGTVMHFVPCCAPEVEVVAQDEPFEDPIGSDEEVMWKELATIFYDYRVHYDAQLRIVSAIERFQKDFKKEV